MTGVWSNEWSHLSQKKEDATTVALAPLPKVSSTCLLLARNTLTVAQLVSVPVSNSLRVLENAPPTFFHFCRRRFARRCCYRLARGNLSRHLHFLVVIAQVYFDCHIHPRSQRQETRWSSWTRTEWTQRFVAVMPLVSVFHISWSHEKRAGCQHLRVPRQLPPQSRPQLSDFPSSLTGDQSKGPPATGPGASVGDQGTPSNNKEGLHVCSSICPQPPKKKADEPAAAPQEPAPAPAPAGEAKEQPALLAEITAKMKAVKVDEGKKSKFTPTRANQPFYVSPGETKLIISKVKKDQYEDIMGLGAASSVKNIITGVRVWVFFWMTTQNVSVPVCQMSKKI
eukprot:g14982.t1